MARKKTKERARKMALTAREILRERDRRFSKLNLESQSSDDQPTTRVLRNQVNHHVQPDLPPPSASHVQTGKLNKKTKNERATLGFITERFCLMAGRSESVLDLANVDVVTPAEGHNSANSQADWKDILVFFSLGFYGYSGQVGGTCKKLTPASLKDNNLLLGLAFGSLQHRLAGLGLRQGDYNVAGYEVCFPSDCTCMGLAVQAGQTVVTRSSDVILSWAKQAVWYRKDKLPEIVLRLVKSDFTMFDPTFRTHRESPFTIVKPIDTFGLLAEEVSEVRNYKSPSTLKRKGKRARVAEALQHEPQVKHKKILRRKIKVLEAEPFKTGNALEADTLKIELMMARQDLTGRVAGEFAGKRCVPDTSVSDLGDTLHRIAISGQQFKLDEMDFDTEQVRGLIGTTL